MTGSKTNEWIIYIISQKEVHTIQNTTGKTEIMRFTINKIAISHHINSQ